MGMWLFNLLEIMLAAWLLGGLQVRGLALAGRYGARPTYVLCTATVGNPGELASGLIGAGDSALLSADTPDGASASLLLVKTHEGWRIRDLVFADAVVTGESP